MRERGRWVESICEVLASQCLHVAPGSYRTVKVRPPSDRDQSDANLLTTLHALRELDARGLPRPEVLYGRRKMTAGLRRNGFPRLSKHTVNRLMRSEGMNGLARSREVRTAIPAENAKRAWDLLNGDFTSGPLRTTLEPPILPCVATRWGFVYVAFAIDLYSRAIVGWRASTVKDAAFVDACLKMILWRRDHAGRPVERNAPPSDAGSQATHVNPVDRDVGAGGFPALDRKCR
jgi:putative transposase